MSKCHPSYRIRRCIPHAPGAVLPELDCSATKRVPIPNDTHSENSQRDVSDADLSGTDTICYNYCGDIDHGKSAQGGVIM